MQEILLIFELEQIEEVISYINTSIQKPRLIVCNFWVECELKKRDIEFESFSTWSFSDEERALWLTKAGDIAREWYRLPELSFLTYKGIRLAEAAEPAVEGYLQNLFYYLAPLKKMLSEAGEVSSVVIVNKKGIIPASAGSFAAFEFSALGDILRFIAKDKKFTVTELGPRPVGEVMPFPPQSKLVLLLRLYNMAVRLVVRKKQLTLFASENWNHIAPFIQDMHDVELALMDRNEIRNIPLKQLLKHRIRFVHPIDLQTKALRESALETQQVCASQWKSAGRDAVSRMPVFLSEGTNLWELIAPALNFFVETYIQRLIFDADALAIIYKKEDIQKVVLRASVSGHQPHFYIAAKVAMRMHIPSIELQHAGAVLDPHNVHSRMEASYLAGYGALTQNIYTKNHGYAPERIVAIGSPRFDAYRSRALLQKEEKDMLIRASGLDPSRPIVLVATPSDQTALVPHVFDSYENARLFSDMAALQKVLPRVQVVFKFRGTSSCTQQHRAYITELFAGKDYAVVGDDLFMRIQTADIVFSSNSTAMYETMMAKKPLVLYPWRNTDTYSLSVYEQAAPRVSSHSERVEIVSKILSNRTYEKELIDNETRFLLQHYAFDGSASKRMIALLSGSLTVQT